MPINLKWKKASQEASFDSFKDANAYIIDNYRYTKRAAQSKDFLVDAVTQTAQTKIRRWKSFKCNLTESCAFMVSAIFNTLYTVYRTVIIIL